MLDDPRSRALADDFAAQWLGFREIKMHAVDFRRFKGFSGRLKSDLYEESARFFDDLVRGDHPVTRLLDADYAFLNARLAKHYGIPGVKGQKLRRVKLPNRQRGGILGMASVLATTSYPLRTSPCAARQVDPDPAAGRSARAAAARRGRAPRLTTSARTA